jgi:molybdate transport system regulatory protein
MRKPAPPRFSFRIDFERGRLGHGKIELLERIARTGSLAAAAREMDMSYRRAWELLSTMNDMFDEPVAVTHPGRNVSGATEVTPFGAQLIRKYRKVETQLLKAARPLIDDLQQPTVALPVKPRRARSRRAG